MGSPQTGQDLEVIIAGLEARLADLKARLPAHSTPPAMIAELEEIEEQLELARTRRAEMSGS
jgi:hypothetical protein